MSCPKKSEISSLEPNFAKLKTIANFLDISQDEVTNVCLYPGLYKFWLPIAKIIDEFPDWDLAPGEETERIYSLKQKCIGEVHAANNIIQKFDVIEKMFNKTHLNEYFNSDLEHYKAFIDFVESQLEEKKPQHSSQVKEIVEKGLPLKVKETTQTEDPLIPNKKSTMRIYLQLLLKSGIFVLSFVASILLLLIISEKNFYWNSLATLQYQPVLFFLLIFFMILIGGLFGWGSILLTSNYQSKTLYRKNSRIYKKLKREFNEETPYREFKGTPTQWYQQLEAFIESKNKDNRS